MVEIIEFWFFILKFFSSFGLRFFLIGILGVIILNNG